MTESDYTDRSGHAGSDSDRSNRSQQDISRARQTAEALFAPKQRAKDPPPLAPAASPDQTTRKPRILSAAPAQPVRVEPLEPALQRLSPMKGKKIPAAHFGRLRTWLKYGMTISQVAELYGVPIGEIENILKKV
jgi:membrane-bound lytic murein transglycosylase B